MTNEAKNVPELRFPEFDGEWENLTLSQVIKVNSGRDYKHLQKGEYPVYGTGGYMLSVSDYLYDSEAIGIGRKGTINKPYLLKGPFWTVDTLFYCTPKENNSIKFLLNLFRTINWKMYDESTGVPSLSKVTINKINKNVPQYGEQQKIGEFFSKLDRQIELEEQKLAKLEEQKKGYMQKIFSQELRFKDENGNTFEEWKNTNFNYFMSEPDNLEKGIDLRKDQLLTVKLEGNGISKANINRALKMGSTVYYKRFAGQFIYGKQNFFNGAFGIVPKFLNNYYSSGDVPALNIDYSKIDSKYFINYISRKDYYKKKEAFSTGTGSKRIHEKTLLDFDIMLPSVEEQEKIGDFFNDLDELIEKQSSKIGVLKQRKKGFLQKMFV
ncbi:restriction endonuclease subunit S [Mammaliicoccus sciuri]